MTLAWWLRQAKALAGPAAMSAPRVMFERSGAGRTERLRAAARDRARERVRPSRPKMKALELRPGGRFAWASLPAPPPPSPLAAVVRPLAIATCDMDRPIALGGTPFPAPLSFGHECVAEVLAVGGDVAAIRPGQRVVVPFQISCGSCSACLGGRTANCEAVPPASMYGFGVSGGHWGGAIADELAVPYADAMLVPLPDGLDPVAAASVADNVSDAYRHIGPHLPPLLASNPDARVVIVGAQSRRHLFTGSVSLYTGLIATALGARDVTLVDARAEVRRQAEALGITALSPDAARRGGPAPLTADVSGTPAGLRFALGMTAPDGTCTSTIARVHARTVIPDVLALMTAGRLHPELVTTAVAGFDDAHVALAEHVREARTKTVISRELR